MLRTSLKIGFISIVPILRCIKLSEKPSFLKKLGFFTVKNGKLELKKNLNIETKFPKFLEKTWFLFTIQKPRFFKRFLNEFQPTG